MSITTKPRLGAEPGRSSVEVTQSPTAHPPINQQEGFNTSSVLTQTRTRPETIDSNTYKEGQFTPHHTRAGISLFRRPSFILPSQAVFPALSLFLRLPRCLSFAAFV